MSGCATLQFVDVIQCYDVFGTWESLLMGLFSAVPTLVVGWLTSYGEAWNIGVRVLCGMLNTILLGSQASRVYLL